MKKLTRATMTAVTAPLIALAVAAPAYAAPGDLQFSPSGKHNELTVQFANNTDYHVQCMWLAKRDTAPEYVYSWFMNLQPRETKSDTQSAFDGDYHINWMCRINEGDFGPQESWGTPGALDAITDDSLRVHVGAEPTGSLGSLGSGSLGSLGTGSLGSLGSISGS
ncbi:hypothetical protein [Rhodococcus sp. ACT016]|uniref:hypothetical protein n=1 Tax=Rhodococcus sp. ACT016 TaxID=3134808 RepID=UPI003D299C34